MHSSSFSQQSCFSSLTKLADVDYLSGALLLWVFVTSLWLGFFPQENTKQMAVSLALDLTLTSYLAQRLTQSAGYDNPNVVIRVTGHRANAVIFFCYMLIVIYALTLAPVAWIYAAEVWSLETRATGVRKLSSILKV